VPGEEDSLQWFDVEEESRGGGQSPTFGKEINLGRRGGEFGDSDTQGQIAKQKKKESSKIDYIEVRVGEKKGRRFPNEKTRSQNVKATQSERPNILYGKI